MNRAPAASASPPASLLLVHGAGSGPWVFHGWASTFPGIDVVAIDLQESLDIRRAGMADYAAAVVAVVARLRQPAVLCGWSMGGLVVLQAALAVNPPSVILLEPSPPAEIQGFYPDVALHEGTFDPEEASGVVTSCAWHGGQIALTNRLIPRNPSSAGTKKRWVAIFDDNEGLDWIRKEHSAAHFEYLKAHQDKVVIAGGLRSAPNDWYCGGLWVLEVDSRDAAVELIEQDPYFRLGLRKHYRLLVWGKAPCYGTVSL